MSNAPSSGSRNDVLLLHLSDIHFVKEYSGSTYDLDSDLRNELERDAVTIYERLGMFSAILVTGDITFALLAIADRSWSHSEGLSARYFSRIACTWP